MEGDNNNNNKEVLLQRRGALEVRARVSKNSLVIYAESASGDFSGISLNINAELIRRLIALCNLLADGYNAREG